MALEQIIRGLARRGLPTAAPDNTDVHARLGRYGEKYVLPLGGKAQHIADEGAYFVATNPTLSTGIVLTGAAQTAYVATTPAVLIRNTESPANPIAKRIIMDFLRLLMTAAGTAGAALHGAVLLDDVNRYTSGGSELTPQNVNMDSGSKSIAKVYFGAITAPAAGPNQRLIARFLLRGAIPVVNDQYTLNFGGVDMPAHGSALGGTAIISQSAPLPPVVIGPGQSLLINFWLPSQTAAPSAETDMGWSER